MKGRLLDPPLTPRAGAVLQVLVIARISTAHQDERSLADQVALCRNWLREHTDLAFELKSITSRGSGECLDRKESAEAVDSVESGRFDLVLTEDLGRIYRRIEALLFCENCLDFGTRLVALNDHVDTAQANWKLSAFFGVMRHEAYNQDTAARIRRSQRNRFENGGVVQTLPYGYEKPDGCRDDSQLRRLSEAQAVYDMWFTMLEQGASYAEVADWLNAQRVPTGPYCRSERWTSFMVGRITRNPILKGVRVRNRKMSKRINKTGRRRSVDAPPEERLERAVPHLAFIAPERYDRVVAMLKARNSHFRRRTIDGRDARQGVPRKRSAWPGNHAACGICRRPFYYGAHGRKNFLMCSGCRGHRCWCAVGVDGPAAAARLSAAILGEVEALPEFDAAFLRLLRKKADAARDAVAGAVAELERRLEKVDRRIASLVGLLAEGERSPAVRAKLGELEAERDRVVVERAELRRRPGRSVDLPSMERIRRAAAEAFAGLARDSPEFGRLMKRLIPTLEIVPCRLLDGGPVVARARLVVELAGLTPEAGSLQGLDGVLRRELVVDLFEPPQRVAFLGRIAELRGGGLTQEQAAAELGIAKAVVRRSEALGRLMAMQGLEDPYVLLNEPPDDAPRLRRHRHPRYRFEPLARAAGPAAPDRTPVGEVDS